MKTFRRTFPKPADPFADLIAARLEAKRSGSITPPKPEPAPVAVYAPRNPLAVRVVSIMFQALGINRQVSERTEA